jgi:hypothetical protein
MEIAQDYGIKEKFPRLNIGSRFICKKPFVTFLSGSPEIYTVYISGEPDKSI